MRKAFVLDVLNFTRKHQVTFSLTKHLNPKGFRQYAQWIQKFTHETCVTFISASAVPYDW